MPSTAFSLLLCPLCGARFSAETEESSLSCGSGHRFDLAKQGYVNFLTGKGTAFAADSAVMAAARANFLEAGHYQELAQRIAAKVPITVDHTPVVLDAGTGTGYYLHKVLQNHAATAVALDISKFALRRAARLNPQAANVVWDIWQPLPLEAASVDMVMVVFAPRNASEFARVLRTDGILVVVTPGPNHLREIAQAADLLGIEHDKLKRLDTTMNQAFSLQSREELCIPLELSPAQTVDLARMGPAGHHLDDSRAEELTRRLESSTTVHAEFVISTYLPLPDSEPASG
ncbi:putative RNA methyltransferase [Pseudarthrobacter sp. J1738]|uniref:putative RNA methyltransferase n=1 Tax=Pseudarthrobacter sp. J1738 TaxID=3420446 RepID=UPI003D2B5601